MNRISKRLVFGIFFLCLAGGVTQIFPALLGESIAQDQLLFEGERFSDAELRFYNNYQPSSTTCTLRLNAEKDFEGSASGKMNPIPPNPICCCKSSKRKVSGQKLDQFLTLLKSSRLQIRGEPPPNAGAMVTDSSFVVTTTNRVKSKKKYHSYLPDSSVTAFLCSLCR